jgi:hypothetical protein
MEDKIINAPYTKMVTLFKRTHLKLAGTSQAEFNFWLSKDAIKFAVKKLRDIEFVPTIYNKEEPEKIRAFYYPCQVYRKKDSSNGYLNVDQYSDFGVDSAIILEGTVGQGKSITLRHLHNKELNLSQTLPLFIELREAKDYKEISDYIINIIESELGFSCSNQLFEDLLTVGFFSFFLDGFDEVEYSMRSKYVKLITRLNNRSCNSKIFVTSRPENEIQKAIEFSIFCLKPLSETEQENFVKKLLKKDSASQSKHFLLKNLDSLSSDLRELLSTPLILTLFYMVYRSKTKIPETHSDFYKNLFDTLVSEHDGLKLGYSRPTQSGYSADEIKSVLEYISWFAMKESTFTASKEEFTNLTRKSLKALNKTSEKAKLVLDDIKKNTCLIQVDDHQYRFLHETIPNYFAAACLENHADDEDAEKFYTSCRSPENWKKHDQTLGFLNDIDKTRFFRYFYLPVISRFFEKEKLPEKFVFTKNGATSFAENIQYVILKNTGDGAVSTISGESQILILFGSKSYVAAKFFDDYSRQTKRVKIVSLHNKIFKEFEYLGLENINRHVKSKFKREELKNGYIYKVPLSYLLDKFKLKDVFTIELNRLPLDPLKEAYKKAYQHLQNKDENKEKGLFEI